jgi:F-box-like
LQPSPEASDFSYHPFVAFNAPEILGEIFRLCLPRDNHKEGAIKAVMLPAHVCKHWRDVALSTPTRTLWIKIVLRVTNGTFESRAALVTTWFPDQAPYLYHTPSEDETPRDNVRRIMAFLLQHCNCWKYNQLPRTI